jgi:allantoinase
MKITGRNVLLNSGQVPGPATLYVDHGVITRIEHVYEYDGDGIDAGEWIVMAGLVDAHVHVNEPGRTDWEGFATATRAAAAGTVK